MQRPEFLTIPEAARLLMVCENTIRKGIREGSIPATVIGKQYRIEYHEMMAATRYEPKGNGR